MTSLARFKKIGSFFFVAFCFHYVILMYIVTLSDEPVKHKLVPRHVTTKTIRGPNYHVHKIDPMPLSMRARYESRRLLVESNRPRLVSRREILDEYRQSSAVNTAGKPVASGVQGERYLSLEREESRGTLLSCGTCALVSNSDHTTGARYGLAIDAADCVFRLNSAPTLGHELDVGRRTTARVVSQRGVPELAANASTLLNDNPSLSTIFIHGSDHAFTLGSTPVLVGRLSAAHPNIDFYRPSKVVDHDADAEFEKYSGKNRIFSGAELSTGFYALMIMKDLCGEIKVYGMVPEEYCRLNPDSPIPYSYFASPSLPECMMYDYHETIDLGGQRLMTERLVFKNWAKTGAIQFYSPSWE